MTHDWIEAGSEAGIEDPVPIAADDLLDPRREEDVGNRHPGRSHPVDHHLKIFQLFLNNLNRIQQRGQDDHRRPMLIVVENRDIEALPEASLNLKTTRRGDVFQINSAEAGGDPLNRLDDLARILRGKADRVSVDSGKLFEEHRFPFHHRHRRFRSDVAESQHRRPVGDHGNAVLLDRKRKGFALVFLNRLTNPRHPGV